jgi:hypothetical protein
MWRLISNLDNPAPNRHHRFNLGKCPSHGSGIIGACILGQSDAMMVSSPGTGPSGRRSAKNRSTIRRPRDLGRPWSGR